MAFIGNTNTTQAFTPAVDFFSGNGSTTAFTLSRPVASVAQVQAVVNNVAQNPSDAFTVSGSTITFTSAPSSGTNNIYVYYTSPITQVIAPGQGTVTTTSLASNFTLPVANGGTGLTTVPHTVQVFTSGSGTYTLPTNCKAILIELVGGGAGGSASSNGTAGSAGGNTTFSTLTGTGGTSSSPTVGGTGGAASGGDINIAGGSASGSYQAYTTAGASYTSGGVGGVSYFGGAGKGAAPGGSTGGAAATNSGSGGGGGAQNTTAYAGTGGGAGGYVRKLINSPSATYSYAVGAAGAGGTAGATDSFAGGAGGSGIIIVTEYYV